MHIAATGALGAECIRVVFGGVPDKVSRAEDIETLAEIRRAVAVRRVGSERRTAASSAKPVSLLSEVFASMCCRRIDHAAQHVAHRAIADKHVATKDLMGVHALVAHPKP